MLLIAFQMQLIAFSVAGQNRIGKDESADVKATDRIVDGNTMRESKIAPDLIDNANDAYNRVSRDRMQRVIIQLPSNSALNNETGDLAAEDSAAMIKEEVRLNKEKTGILVTDLHRSGGRMYKAFNNIGLVDAELPLSQINELIKSDSVAYISPDREVAGFGHVGLTAGLYNTGISDRGDSDANTWLVGSGIGVAVIDSGVYGAARPFSGLARRLSKVTSYDFTGTGQHQRTSTDTVATSLRSWRGTIE